MVPKSQEDPETIEQAIDRIVASHNDDPTAHLGTGQSLEEHRQNDVIDHPAGSILADKVTPRQMWFEYPFHTLDDWSHSAVFYTLSSPGVEVSIPSGAAATYYLFTTPYDALDWMDWSKNPYFEAFAYLNVSSGRYREIAWGSAIGDNVLGFRADGTTLYAVCIINGSDHTASISGAVTSGRRNYRAYVDPATGNVNFEIDGVLVKQLTGLTLSGADESGLAIVGKRVSGATDSWAVFSMVMARDL